MQLHALNQELLCGNSLCGGSAPTLQRYICRVGGHAQPGLTSKRPHYLRGCAAPGKSAMPVQHARAPEQAQEDTSPEKKQCDMQVSSCRHIGRREVFGCLCRGVSHFLMLVWLGRGLPQNRTPSTGPRLWNTPTRARVVFD